MRTGAWWQGHSESHCCSSAEGPEPGDHLESQGAGEQETTVFIAEL